MWVLSLVKEATQNILFCLCKNWITMAVQWSILNTLKEVMWLITSHKVHLLFIQWFVNQRDSSKVCTSCNYLQLIYCDKWSMNCPYLTKLWELKFAHFRTLQSKLPVWITLTSCLYNFSKWPHLTTSSQSFLKFNNWLSWANKAGSTPSLFSAFIFLSSMNLILPFLSQNTY